MYRKKLPAQQQTMWLPTAEIVSTTATSFHQKLDDALEPFDCPAQVHHLCDPFYCICPSNGGRPGIDPVVYFKLLVIGFFENITSERGIASRCADSLSIRRFLHYELTEATPEHSSFSAIR